MDMSDFVPLREARRLLPGPVSLTTLHRWKDRGINGVRLQTVLIGGRRYVSRRALETFIAQVTTAVDGTMACVSDSRAQHARQLPEMVS